MTPYSILITDNLKGDTPHGKYNNLILMKSILNRIAYPRRGSADEMKTIFDFADEIQESFYVNELE